MSQQIRNRNMKLNKFKKIVSNTAPEKRELISRNMDILERIHELLDLKFGGKQNLLAAKMGKTEPEISKLLSGFQNYTMLTLIKFELAFEAPIISVHTGKEIAKAHFIQAKISECLKEKQVVQVKSETVIRVDNDYKVVKTYSN